MSALAGLPDIDIARWVRCEREALHGPDGARSGRTHVASLVRQGAMRRIAGEDAGTLELGFPVQLDEISARLDDVPRQSAAIAAEADRLLETYDNDVGVAAMVLAVLSAGWLVTIPGDRTDSTAILHLRTGRTIGAAWLELGRVLAEYSPSDRPDLAGIVHVPRTRIHRECKGTMTVRDGFGLVGEWKSWERRVQAVLTEGSDAARAPGPALPALPSGLWGAGVSGAEGKRERLYSLPTVTLAFRFRPSTLSDMIYAGRASYSAVYGNHKAMSVDDCMASFRPRGVLPAHEDGTDPRLCDARETTRHLLEMAAEISLSREKARRGPRTQTVIDRETTHEDH